VRPSVVVGVALLIMLGLSVLAPSAKAQTAPGDIGYEGPSSLGAGKASTGEKPESKLWWNDGFWWASMWDTGSADFHIFKLDVGTQTWTDTGVALDDRAGTRADVLWDGAAGKLYVASHRFSESPATGFPSRLYRYSYNSATDTYTRDAGFPVSINNFRTETLVIDKDSTGQLWATWMQGGNVWVNATVCSPTCNDANWGTAFSISPSPVTSDDISSVIAFGGSRIGVMWSNQNNWTFGFAMHDDSQADDVWSLETALSGTRLSDDHINLKSDSSGRVYAAVKTSKSSSNDPLTMLLVRQAGGSWSSHVFGLKKDNHTRPIVQIDEEHGILHMFATSSGSGGSIMEKTAPLGSVSFAPGKGTAVITDADGVVNNVTSTKQNLGSATGLVVLAHSSKNVYFHAYNSLSGGGPSPPAASFTAAPASGVAPLTVQFTDTSSGTVDSRAWDFQNDGVVDSTVPSPTFTYTSPNTYTAKLTVTNSAGSSSATRTITVSPAGGGSTLTFTPSDDAYVRSGTPGENAGAQATIRAFKNLDETNSYLKFSVAGVRGPVTSATLRLFVVDGSSAAGSIYSVTDTVWSEGTITWTTRPEVGSMVAGAGSAPVGTWVEFNLGSAVAGGGTYSFALKDGNANAVWYSSKEGANDPQLVVTFGP
jgi:trimeric autotransporter adhesin